MLMVNNIVGLLCESVMEFMETMGFFGLQIDLVLYFIREFNFGNIIAATSHQLRRHGVSVLASRRLSGRCHWCRFTTILVGSGVEITLMKSRISN